MTDYRAPQGAARGRRGSNNGYHAMDPDLGSTTNSSQWNEVHRGSVGVPPVDKSFESRYLARTKIPIKTTIQGKVYNFLERPTGWKCFIYHFTVWVCFLLFYIYHSIEDCQLTVGNRSVLLRILSSLWEMLLWNHVFPKARSGEAILFCCWLYFICSWRSHFVRNIHVIVRLKLYLMWTFSQIYSTFT